MYKIILSKEAVDNLQDIKDFISIDNVVYAEKVIDVIMTTITSLSTFPNIWKNLHWYNWLKELVEPNFQHRIIYRISDDEIEIVSIFKYMDKF